MKEQIFGGKYELRDTGTRTSSSSTQNYVLNVTVVKVPWWKQLWRWTKRTP
jgi:hypothetical protein